MIIIVYLCCLAEELKTHVGSFRLTVFCYHFCRNAFPSSTKYVGLLLILLRNSDDETTLDLVAFLRELIMIRDSSLTLSGLLSSNELLNLLIFILYSVLRVRFNNE